VRLFVDSANLADIEDALRTGAISGVTTNPSILAKEGVADRMRRYQKIVGLLEGQSLSVELVGTDPERMIFEAYDLAIALKYPNLAIKVPMRWSWLQVVRELRDHEVQTNVTACMTYAQAIVGAMVGATYVSMFWNRIRDGGEQPADIVRAVRTTFDAHVCNTQIIVGSIRSTQDVTDAIMAGADIVTVPPQFLAPLCEHPKTDEVISQFLRDAKQPIHV
jgi:transaldolase